MTERDITHTRGDTYVQVMQFTDSTGAPINITGSTIKFTIKLKYDDATPAASATATLTDPTNGRFTVTISATNMRTLTSVEAYYYDVQWTDSNGIVKTVQKGRFLNTFDVS